MQKFTIALVSAAVVSIGQVSATWPYYSGELKTIESFTYGKFRTSMRMSDHDATVGTFFSYWEGPGKVDGNWNEIDIEIVPSCEI
jgi:beta-glucanase (GH16 family)